MVAPDKLNLTKKTLVFKVLNVNIVNIRNLKICSTMKNIKSLSIALISLTIFTSCHQNNREVRFVNLQGTPGQLQLTTPSENLRALSRQGRASEAALNREKQYRNQTTPAKKYNVNKYAVETPSNNFTTPNPTTKIPSENPELLYTVKMPVEEKGQTAKSENSQISSKNIYIEKEIPNNNIKKPSNPRVISEIRIPAKSSYNESEIVSGLYVQAGSFRSKNVAKSHLEKIKKITNNPSNVKIQEAIVKNKQYFRVVIGPITKKSTANIISKNLKEKGQNSILIKVK